jgi:hypothetical protein
VDVVHLRLRLGHCISLQAAQHIRQMHVVHVLIKIRLGLGRQRWMSYISDSVLVTASACKQHSTALTPSFVVTARCVSFCWRAAETT